MDQEIDEIPRAADERGGSEDDESLEKFTLTEGIAAHRGHQDRGEACNGGEQNVLADADVGETDDVGEQVLGGAGNEIQQKHQALDQNFHPQYSSVQMLNPPLSPAYF